jgi:hypothetical protein
MNRFNIKSSSIYSSSAGQAFRPTPPSSGKTVRFSNPSELSLDTASSDRASALGRIGDSQPSKPSTASSVERPDFSAFDLDGDGAVTKDEYEAAGRARVKEREERRGRREQVRLVRGNGSATPYIAPRLVRDASACSRIAGLEWPQLAEMLSGELRRFVSKHIMVPQSREALFVLLGEQFRKKHYASAPHMPELLFEPHMLPEDALRLVEQLEQQLQLEVFQLTDDEDGGGLRPLLRVHSLYRQFAAKQRRCLLRALETSVAARAAQQAFEAKRGPMRLKNGDTNDANGPHSSAAGTAGGPTPHRPAGSALVAIRCDMSARAEAVGEGIAAVLSETGFERKLDTAALFAPERAAAARAAEARRWRRWGLSPYEREFAMVAGKRGASSSGRVSGRVSSSGSGSSDAAASAADSAADADTFVCAARAGPELESVVGALHDALMARTLADTSTAGQIRALRRARRLQRLYAAVIGRSIPASLRRLVWWQKLFSREHVAKVRRRLGALAARRAAETRDAAARASAANRVSGNAGGAVSGHAARIAADVTGREDDASLRPEFRSPVHAVIAAGLATVFGTALKIYSCPLTRLAADRTLNALHNVEGNTAQARRNVFVLLPILATFSAEPPISPLMVSLLHAALTQIPLAPRVAARAWDLLRSDDELVSVLLRACSSSRLRRVTVESLLCEWAEQALVGVVPMDAVLYVWDHCFLLGWEEQLPLFLVDVVTLMRPRLLECTHLQQLTRVWRTGPSSVTTRALRDASRERLWKSPTVLSGGGAEEIRARMQAEAARQSSGQLQEAKGGAARDALAVDTGAAGPGEGSSNVAGESPRARRAREDLRWAQERAEDAVGLGAEGPEWSDDDEELKRKHRLGADNSDDDDALKVRRRRREIECLRSRALLQFCLFVRPKSAARRGVLSHFFLRSTADPTWSHASRRLLAIRSARAPAPPVLEN